MELTLATTFIMAVGIAIIFAIAIVVARTISLIFAVVSLASASHAVITIAWPDENMRYFVRGDNHQPLGIVQCRAIDMDAVTHTGMLRSIVRPRERNRKVTEDQGFAINFGDTAVDAEADHR